jgi:glc operon protein GlcG
MPDKSRSGMSPGSHDAGATGVGNGSPEIRAILPGDPVPPRSCNLDDNHPRDQEVLRVIEMTLDMAEKAVKAAQARARTLGTPMSVTVVDEAGRLVLCARGDGTGFLTTETSRGKAAAAAAFRRATKDMVDLAREHPAFWTAITPLAAGQILPSTGGVPIRAAGRVIGAIGCGGGTGEQDHECAVAGADAIGSS